MPPVGKSGPVTYRAEVVVGDLGVVDERDGRVDDLAEVVRRDVRRHPDRDARRTVDQEVRQLRRQDRGLLLRAVVVVLEVDGLLVDVGEHLAGDRRQARLRVAHRRGGVAVDRAEVALAVDERIAHREVLGEPDEGVVQGDVAVRVVLAHHLADDRGALAIGARGREAHLAHRVQDPAMDGLEAVADVRQRARHDHAHRVVEVARPASRPRCGWSGCCRGRRSRGSAPRRVWHQIRGGWGIGRPRPISSKRPASSAATEVEAARRASGFRSGVRGGRRRRPAGASRGCPG